MATERVRTTEEVIRDINSPAFKCAMCEPDFSDVLGQGEGSPCIGDGIDDTKDYPVERVSAVFRMYMSAIGAPVSSLKK